jgi:tripartite-type tricarboxylate transporter receptor subunit TctC
MEYLKLQSQTNMVHVPYRGTVPAVTDLVAGQIQAVFTGAPAVMPFVKSGKLKVIAVGSKKRSVSMPDVLTVAEAGVPGFAAQTWAALLAPAQTPKAIVTKMNAELNLALQKTAIKERLMTLGAEVFEGTPDQAVEHIKFELANWAAAVKASGAKAD